MFSNKLTGASVMNTKYHKDVTRKLNFIKLTLRGYKAVGG